ncbi:MAG: protein tyrosine phosphatase family protein [Chloroflexi bacterium]|nr:protein tyrosine phosphatase family protein [Chloroflexota bacterium]
MENIYNYLKLSDTLFTSGMPTPEQIPSIAENGVQVVINLATSKSEGWMPNEKELMEAQHVSYYNIPVDWGNPTPENLNEFTSIMDKHNNDKVLVHCQANYRATGFVTLYRVNRLGMKKEDAFKDLRKIWNPAEYPIWEKFIEESMTK